MLVDGSWGIGVLGPLEVTVDGVPAALGARRNREVLAALTVDAGRVVPADVVLDRVWGEDGAGGSMSNLHAILSRVRTRLAEAGITDPIETRAPGYLLRVAPEQVDAHRFGALLGSARRLLAAGDAEAARDTVQEALDLWRGPAYADVRSRFAELEASRLAEQRLAAVELRAELDLALGRHVELVGTLGTLVAEHPLREPLRRALMLALYRSGRQADALAAYDEGRAVLADELGLDPGPELQRLHQLVLRQDPSLVLAPAAVVPPTAPPAPAPAAPAAAPSPAAPALVGREQELATVLAAVGRGAGTGPGVVLVVGESGIGKTRLVEEVARVAGRDSTLVAWGRCWDRATSPAFWPWEQALASIVEEVGIPVARRCARGRAAAAALLVPALAEEGADQPAAGEIAPTRLYDAVAAFLEAVSATRPVLVVLEDLHRADPESVELAEYLAGSLRSGRLTVVLTVRTPPELRDGPGEALLAGLTGLPSVARVDLHGLDAGAVRELVEERVGRPVEEVAARALLERTDGNPLYLTELSLLLGEERQRSGRADVPVPAGVRAVVERRVRHLPAGDTDVLGVAAVLGREFDVAVLAEIAGQDVATLAPTLDRATAAGLLAEGAAPGRHRFVQALVQETLALSIGPVRRSALHARAAEVLERRYGPAVGDHAAEAAEVAGHWVAAGAVGDPARAVRLSLDAGAAAQRRLAYQDAERQVRRAVELLELLPPAQARDLELEARVHLGSLLSLRLGYNAPEVAAERHRALELATVSAPPEHLLSALWGTWGNALVSGAFEEADAICDRMEDVVWGTGDPVLEVAWLQARGQVRWHQGHLDEAHEDLAAAVGLADAHRDELPLELFLQHPSAAARAWLAVVLAMRGEVAASDRVAAEARQVCDRLRHPFTESYCGILEGLRLAWLERPADACAACRHALDLAREHRFGQLEAFGLIPEGWALARMGDPAAGADRLRSATEVFGALPSGHMLGHLMHGWLADVLREAGDQAGATRALARAFAESERTGERFHLAELHRLRGLLAQAAGAPEEAARCWAAAVDLAQDQGAALFAERATALLDRVR